MKRTIKTMATLLAAPFALLFANVTFADAERPNYNYVELDYVYSTADVNSDVLGSNVSSDAWYVPEGVALKASFVLLDQLLLRGSYYTGEGKYKSTHDIEVSSFVASVGWLTPTTDATGIDVSLDYRTDNLQHACCGKFDEDISGPGISIGLRAAPSEHIEIGLRTGWYEGDFEGAIAFGLNVAWNISDHWGINASWDRIDADPKTPALSDYVLNQYALGGRFYF